MKFSLRFHSRWRASLLLTVAAVLGLVMLAGSSQLRPLSLVVVGPELAQAQTTAVTVYTCEELLSKLRQVANGDVVAAVDNCTVVNNKIRAIVRMNQETCTIVNSLPYCQNSPNDAWIDAVQANNRTLIRDLIKNPEPNGFYVRKCQNDGDPWPPGDGISWLCKRNRIVDGNTQTITDRTWLTISPRSTSSISADRTSVSFNNNTFTLTWQTQFADTVYLQKSSDGNNWQPYQGYSYSLTPPSGGSQTIGAGGSSSGITHTYFRTVSTNPYNQQGYGQNDRAGYSNTLDITISPNEPPTLSLTFSPDTVDYLGQTTLTWNSTNADSITISPDDFGGTLSVPSGSKTYSPSKTTTFTATATGPGGTTSTTATITVNRPDLVPDVSNVKFFVDGVETTRVNFGSDTKKIEVEGIKVKNIGPGTFSGAFLPEVFTCFNPGREDPSDPFKYSVYGARGNRIYGIAPNTTVNLGRVDITQQLNSKHYTNLLQIFDCRSLHVRVWSNLGGNRLPPRWKIDASELRKDNNYTSIANVMSWPELTINILLDTSSGEVPAPKVEVTVAQDKIGSYQENELSDKDGKVWLGPLPKPDTPATYLISAFYNNDTFQADPLVVSAYTRYTVNLLIRGDGLSIEANPLEPAIYEPDPSKYKTAPYLDYTSSGQVTVTLAAARTQSTYPIVKGRAEIKDLPVGKKLTVNKIEATYTMNFDPSFKDQKVNYLWTDKESGPLELTYTGKRQVERVDLKLPMTCSTPKGTSIKLCLYDDATNSATARTTWLPVFNNVLTQFTNFPPPAGLSIIKEVYVLPIVYGIGSHGVAHPDRVNTSSRYSAIDNTLAKDLITHELLHALDHQLSLSGSSYYSDSLAYRQSVALSVNDAVTGKWIWENLGWTCSYVSGAVRDKCGGHQDALDGPGEIFAEQFSSLCVFPADVRRRLEDYRAIYAANPLRDANGSPLPMPDNLKSYVKVLASRSIGLSEYTRGTVITGFDANGTPTTASLDKIMSLANSCDSNTAGVTIR